MVQAHSALLEKETTCITEASRLQLPVFNSRLVPLCNLELPRDPAVGQFNHARREALKNSPTFLLCYSPALHDQQLHIMGSQEDRDRPTDGITGTAEGEPATKRIKLDMSTESIETSQDGSSQQPPRQRVKGLASIKQE